MELQATCIGYQCQYAQKKGIRGQCKLVKKKWEQQCPVYHYAPYKVELSTSDAYRYQKCPSCGRIFIITEQGGEIYCNDVWGLICGYCLYQFYERGWPLGQTPISCIKKRIDMDDVNDRPTWDIV